MRFQIDQNVLDDALKTVQFALLTRPSLPVLNNVLIKADSSGVQFTLTDQEISISCKAEAEVSEDGETTLPMRRLISIVRRLPGLAVSFTNEEDDFTEIKCDDIIFKIQGVNTSEFPESAAVEYENKISVLKSLINKAVINTSFATGTDPTRPIISGPLFEFSPNKLNCVATDGKRLAMETLTIESSIEGKCVIPQKTNNALMKLMAGDGEVTISFDEKSVQFEFINEYGQETTIYSKLIEGKFPKYQAILPEGHNYQVSINRSDFHERLRRIALILSESTQGVKLIFQENKLTMHASTEDDESNEEMGIDYNAEKQQIAFNPTYLIDPLKRLESDNVELSFTDTHKAASITNDDGFVYVLMPMRM